MESANRLCADDIVVHIFSGKVATLAALCLTSYSVSASDLIQDLLRQLVTCLNQWDFEILGRGVINYCFCVSCYKESIPEIKK